MPLHTAMWVPSLTGLNSIPPPFDEKLSAMCASYCVGNAISLKPVIRCYPRARMKLGISSIHARPRLSVRMVSP